MNARASTTARKDSGHESGPATSAGNGKAPFRPGANDIVQKAAGNQALARLFASGALRPKLHVGSADDPLEREADALAHAAVHGNGSCACAGTGHPCAECQAGTIRMKARTRRGPSSTDGVSLGSSRPLAASDRSFFESRFDTDLSGVRVHDNPEAASSASQLGADAFALGSHIAFGRGRYQPHLGEGRLLLAHELAHVVGGHGGVRRQPTSSSADAPVCEQPAEGGGECSIHDQAAHVDHATDYNPCNVNVGNLTNYELLAEYNSALAVVRQGRDATGYFDYRNLQRRLITERDRRIGLGHKWLASMPTTIPETLYTISDRGDGAFDVVGVPGATASGSAEEGVESPLMTRAQFDRWLETHNVEQMDADTYRMRLRQDVTTGAEFGSLFSTGGLYNTPLDVMLRSPFAGPPGSNRWMGNLGESSYQGRLGSGYGMFVDDLNARPWVDRRGRTQSGNYPLMDFQRTQGTRGVSILGTLRVSNKVSTQATQAGRQSYFRQGLQALYDTGSRPSGMGSYVVNQPEFAGSPRSGPQYEANRSAVLQDAVVAINSDEVGPMQRLLSDPTQRETGATRTMWEDTGGFQQTQQGRTHRAGWRQLFQGEMREHPVRIGTQTYSTPDALDQARDSGAISADQHAAAQREVGRRVAGRVVSTGISTTELTNLRTQRGGLSSIPDAQLGELILPEHMRSMRAGGGVGGEFRAAGGATVQGAGVSSLIGVITTVGIMWIDEADHPNWQEELATTGTLSGLGGGIGSGAEQLMISGGNRMMLTSIAETGASRLTPGLVTGAGRFGGGAIGAVFVEGISMGVLEEREHSGAEVGTRVTRSAALGGSSVWAGAAIGTAVGGPVGFVVGLVAGGVLYYVGDKLVPGGREDWDAHEAGCTPLPTVTRWTSAGSSSTSGFNSMIFMCFDGATPILMADGSSRAIETIRAGEDILSYNELDRRVEPRRVEKVHEAAPDMMIELWFDNGAHLLVTEAHKLAGPYGWCAAGELRVGDELFAADATSAGAGDAGLSCTRLFSSRRTMPRGPVYDLSVDTTRTYFAHGILAHNKLP